MHVLAVHSSNDMYGSDRIFLQSITALRDAGHEVQVWLPEDAPAGSTSSLADHADKAGIAHERLVVPVLRRAYLGPRGLVHLIRRSWTFSRRLREARPDLVYLGSSALVPVALLARLRRSSRVVLHVQELWEGTEGRVLRGLSRSAHRCIASSPAVARAMGQGLALRTTVVTNAVPDPGRVTPPAATTSPTFLVASRWTLRKGYETLLEAWHQAPTGSTLIIAGGPPAAGVAFDVVSAVGRLGEPSSVVVVGEVEDLNDLIRSCDVVVVPSNAPEGFGLIAVEAFALSRPVIGSAAGGLADIIQDGSNGMLVPMGDSEGLGRALRAMAAEDLERMGQEARRSYEIRYGSQRFAWEFLDACGVTP